MHPLGFSVKGTVGKWVVWPVVTGHSDPVQLQQELLISGCSQVVEGFHLGGLRISSLLIVDDGGGGVQLTLELLAAE